VKKLSQIQHFVCSMMRIKSFAVRRDLLLGLHNPY
jgi:hypothetical protein